MTVEWSAFMRSQVRFSTQMVIPVVIFSPKQKKTFIKEVTVVSFYILIHSLESSSSTQYNSVDEALNKPSKNAFNSEYIIEGYL
jgi:hypothetical protein